MNEPSPVIEDALTSASPPSRKAIARLLILLSTLAGPPALAEATGAAFDPDRLGWSEARLKATKLFRSMRVTLGVERPEPSAAAAVLVASDEHVLLPPPPDLVGLRYLTDGLGRRNDTTLLVDPGSGQVLQRISHETGKRFKYRVYRFGTDGVLRRTRRPLGSEENQAPEAWSDRREQWFEVPDAAAGNPLTEPGTLIYLVAASGLASTGERFELHAFSTSDETVYRIEAEVLGPERIDFDYRLASGAGERAAAGRVEAVRVAIRGRPLAGADGGELTVLGMRNVELLLDPATRAPLQLRGRVSVFGGVTFKLKRLDAAG